MTRSAAAGRSKNKGAGEESDKKSAKRNRNIPDPLVLCYD